MSTHMMIAATALMGALASPAGAQQHQHAQEDGDAMTGACPMMHAMGGQMMDGMGEMGMHGMESPMMGSGMMGTMGATHAGPGMILGASDALELTPAQIDQLQALQERGGAEHREHMQAAMSACQDASAALAGAAPDLDAYAAQLNEAADHMVVAHVAMTRTALEAHELLTPEQRERLDDMGGARGGMMDGSGASGDAGDH